MRQIIDFNIFPSSIPKLLKSLFITNKIIFGFRPSFKHLEFLIIIHPCRGGFIDGATKRHFVTIRILDNANFLMEQTFLGKTFIVTHASIFIEDNCQFHFQQSFCQHPPQSFHMILFKLIFQLIKIET